MIKKTLFLLDGNALLHRAWHAIPPLTTKDGIVVNAAYGVCLLLEKLLADQKPDKVIVAWDLPGKTFRHEMFEAYKAQRETKEQALYDQIPLIQGLLDAHGITSVSVPGYEADDVIGTFSRLAANKGIDTMIVTGDQDAMQLVGPHVSVLTPKKGLSDFAIYDEKAVVERYGLTPIQLIEYKALRGDTSDNIPGVAGIGEKGATELLQSFESVDAIYKALEKGEVPEKFAKKLRGQEETAKTARTLVTVVRDLPLDLEAAMNHAPANENQIRELYEKYEFRTLLRRRGSDGTIPPPPLEMKEQKAAGSIEVLENEADFLKKMNKLSHARVSVGCIGLIADLFSASALAIGLSDGKHTIVSMRTGEKALEQIGEWLSEAKQIIGFDLKSFMHKTGLTLPPAVLDDAMIAAYLLNPGARELNHEVVYSNEGIAIPTQPAAFDSKKAVNAYAGALALLPELWSRLEKKLSVQGVADVYTQLEKPLISILYEMERVGIAVDGKSLKNVMEDVRARVDVLSREIQKQAGAEFNPNSPSQLAWLLFEKLQLPTKGIKKTKTGYSTRASELEKLEGLHPIIALMGEYRELSKLLSTYLEPLPGLIKKDGRIHTTFNQAIAATGRLSSTDPNMQNIPIRSDVGNEIRKAFIAPRGWKLIAADYGQLELRLAAAIAHDKSFIEAFNSGADIHTRTAAEVFSVPEADVTSDQRRAAKAINFGILYGMGPRSLARATKMSFDEAKIFIETYFAIHTGIKNYLEETKAKAHAEGFVETLFGRRRYLPEIHTDVHMLREAAERMAINMPVQGTEADLMKKAMILIDGWLKKSGWRARMLLQVHDEIVFEAPAEEVEAVSKGVKELMETALALEVPLLVNIEVGENWGEMA